MKTNSFSRKNSGNKESIISETLVTKSINKIARLCGYIQRSTGKISPKNLIVGFMLMASKQRNTYSDWATEIGLLEGKTITRQSLNERMQPQTEMLIRTVVEETIRKKIPILKTKKIKGVLKHFKSVKIDDSTTVHLPDELVEKFPGNVSRGKRKAQVKIHAMYNLTENNFEFLNIHSYSNNDQSISAHVLPYLQKGDLCIRDLGFTILDVVSEFVENGIYFIARKNYSTNVYEIATGAEINLLKELRKKGFIDREVLIGKKQQLKIRLVAVPIPAPQAEERRRKAYKDRNQRLNRSPQYYQLLDYSIYITNISFKQCNAEQIFDLYKLRWNIEIIFKSWKSCFSLEKLIHRGCKNVIRVNCIIYLMLLYIYLFHVVWWTHCESKIENEPSQKILSILKMAAFFRNHFIELITTTSDKKIIEQIKIHCGYDKRKDRANAIQLQLKLAA